MSLQPAWLVLEARKSKPGICLSLMSDPLTPQVTTQFLKSLCDKASITQRVYPSSERGGQVTVGMLAHRVHTVPPA